MTSTQPALQSAPAASLARVSAPEIDPAAPPVAIYKKSPVAAMYGVALALSGRCDRKTPHTTAQVFLKIGDGSPFNIDLFFTPEQAEEFAARLIEHAAYTRRSVEWLASQPEAAK